MVSFRIWVGWSPSNPLKIEEKREKNKAAEVVL
jgi:hypothetical protein